VKRKVQPFDNLRLAASIQDLEKIIKDGGLSVDHYLKLEKAIDRLKKIRHINIEEEG
jgi:hypothetical protein